MDVLEIIRITRRPDETKGEEEKAIRGMCEEERKGRWEERRALVGTETGGGTDMETTERWRREVVRAVVAETVFSAQAPSEVVQDKR